MSFPILHLVGRRLPSELRALAQKLQQTAIVYVFETTDELLAGWRLARRQPQLTFAPQAVVWLQSRAGEFSQHEVAEVQTLDPLANPIVVAGCWCEGEPRSGRLLTGVKRIYWHQGAVAVLRIAQAENESPQIGSQWIAIHAAQYADFQGLAGVCESLGLRTLWQADQWPTISSSPDVRIFRGWSAWQTWCERIRSDDRSTPAILLLDFPRPADHQRAAAEGIAAVVALPFLAADLVQVISQIKSSPGLSLRRCDPPQSHNQHQATIFPRRRSA